MQTSRHDAGGGSRGGRGAGKAAPTPKAAPREVRAGVAAAPGDASSPAVTPPSSFPRRIFERLFALVFSSRVKAFAGVPGPRPIFPFGNGLDLLKDLHKVFEGYRETYGDYVIFWVLGQPSLLVNEPDLIAEILIQREGDYPKNVPRDATRPVMGDSVFRSVGGQDWAVKRADHPFEARGVDAWYEEVVPVVRAVARDHLTRLVPVNGPAHADFFDELYRMSFQVFANTVLGASLSWDDFDDHAALLNEIALRGNMPVAFSWSPIFWYRRWRWMRMIERRLHERAPDADAQAPSLVAFYARAHGGSRGHAPAGGGSRLGEEHLRDEVSNVFSAGMKNVAIAVAAVLFLLSRHPAVLAKVLAELDAALAARGPELSRADLSAAAMPYLDRVLKEALRVYPVVPGFVREVKPGRGVTLGGRALPDTTQIFVTAWTMHHHPALWKDPLRFDPDRFLTEPPPHRYLPFGMGARSCVGEHFTVLCVKTMLTTILATYSVDVDASCTFDTTLVAGTIPPKDGMPATLVARAR